jgi:YidC/Oxa1 family membrane protein insertase
VFQAAAWLISFFYSLVPNYAIAIGLVAVTVMLLLTPLTLKQTKSMLEMQKLQPELKRLQVQYRGDRQKLNEEMMKLYQEHKVNPLASCLPLLAQLPVFIIMFRVLSGLTYIPSGQDTFDPKYISHSSDLYQSLVGQTEMVSFGINLAATPKEMIQSGFPDGLPYVIAVLVLAGLYFVQQRMVASRATSPTMSPTQQKVMQYLPVAFAVFQIFLPTALVVYYITQAIVRIAQQYYITRRFYHGEESLGRQAQAASAKAREIGKSDTAGSSKPAPPPAKAGKDDAAPRATTSKRTTPPKNRPTPSSSRPQRPSSRSGSRHPKPPRP